MGRSAFRIPLALRHNGLMSSDRTTSKVPSRIPPSGEHGGDSQALADALDVDVDDIVDLSASMNPFAVDAAAVVGRHLDGLRRYPDPRRATASLADVIGVELDRMVLTNGGAEAIALVAELTGPGWIAQPEFSLYQRHLPSLDRAGLRWRSNPSNPLGRLAASTERSDVWDEAFYPLATGRWTRGDEGPWRLGSLTKLWSCPGLRLGYAIAPDVPAADLLRARQPRWAVNALALAAVADLLVTTDLAGWSRDLADARNELCRHGRAVGMRVDDTDANWVLIREPRLRERLALHRVLVRDCASFGLDDVFRMAVPRPSDRDRVFDALALVGRESGRFETEAGVEVRPISK